MDNQPSIDRTIIVPILIGAISIFGILIIFLIGRVNASRASVSVEPTETPYKYIYLGTEPLPSVEITAGTAEEGLFTETPFGGLFDTPTLGLPVVTPTFGTVGPSTNTPPGTVASPTRAASIVYDDTDSLLVYTGSWVPQSNVTGAYQGTLHVSTTVNNQMVFLVPILGDRIRFSYQAGPSLGAVTVIIDGLHTFSISQASSTTQIVEWESNPLPMSNHDIVIVHSGGGSINIDSISIPQSTTGNLTLTTTPPTPTRTPTGTPP